MSSPAIRARSAQEALAYADRFEPGAQGCVRKLVPPDTLAFVDGLSTNAWLPVEHDRWMPRAIVGAHGRDGAFEIWRTFIHSHVESPLLGPMFKAASRLLGLNPGTVAWLVQKGFTNVYRNFATPRLVERRDGYACFVLEDIHPEVWAVPEYLLCFHATFQGLVDLTSRGQPAELQVEQDAEARRLKFEIRW